MPAAAAAKGRRGAVGTGEGAAANMHRQLEEIKRQKARIEVGAAKRPAAVLAGGGLAKGSAQAPVRLMAASGLAVRRLGVPLRSGGPVAGPPRKRARLAMPAAPPPVVKLQVASEDEQEDNSHKRRTPALLIAKAEAVGYGYGGRDSGNEAGLQQVTEAGDGGRKLLKPRALLQRRRPVAVADPRGRNMVGALLGQLASARRMLQNENGDARKEGAARSMRTSTKVGRTALRTAALRTAPVKRAAAAAAAQTAEQPGTKGLVKQELAERRQDEEQEEANDSSTQEKEMQLLQRRLEGHYAHMKNFIRTQAEPTIFYLPARHTPTTQRYLEETRLAIEQKIRSLKVHLQCTGADEDAEAEQPDHYEDSGEGSSSGEEVETVASEETEG